MKVFDLGGEDMVDDYESEPARGPQFINRVTLMQRGRALFASDLLEDDFIREDLEFKKAHKIMRRAYHTRYGEVLTNRDTYKILYQLRMECVTYAWLSQRGPTVPLWVYKFFKDGVSNRMRFEVMTAFKAQQSGGTRE